ncbi:MAG: hypothetical protein Ct9H300mP12_15040 [Acidimicrobiales bacterium]|nr:MAG: hypothetical protein Ct9H300mP12_15040 [Acidimicrobiales bacterium]
MIRDPTVWAMVLEAVDVAIRDCGAAIMEGMPSPITGPTGTWSFWSTCAPARPVRRWMGLDWWLRRFGPKTERGSTDGVVVLVVHEDRPEAVAQAMP